MVKEKNLDEKRTTRNALSTEIANQLCSQIRRERMNSGTLLGTEASLAQQFNVSRTVIREAIGQLRGLGIITSRQGHGLSVVSGNAIDTMAKVLAPAMDDKATWSELCHMRFVLEIGSLPLAVERATLDQIDRMGKLAEEMRAMLKPDHSISLEEEERIAQIEIEFHEMIFIAAGSEFTGQFHSVLVEYFYESTGNRPHSSLPTIKDMDDHMKLVDAMTRHDTGEAVAIMIDHIRHTLLS